MLLKPFRSILRCILPAGNYLQRCSFFIFASAYGICRAFVRMAGKCDKTAFCSSTWCLFHLFHFEEGQLSSIDHLAESCMGLHEENVWAYLKYLVVQMYETETKFSSWEKNNWKLFTHWSGWLARLRNSILKPRGRFGLL